MSKFQKSLLITTISGLLLWNNDMTHYIHLLIIGELLLIAHGVVSLQSQFFGPAITSLNDTTKVALTFDDGPTSSTTPQVLALLKKYKISATFFVIAQKAKDSPHLVQEIVKQGHTLGSHDLYHNGKENFRLTAKALTDIHTSCEILEEISGQKIRIYRPPVGIYNPHIAAAVKKLELTTVGWSATIRDAGNRNSAHIKKIPKLAQAQDSSILIFHDSAPDIKHEALFLEKLEELIILLKKEEREFVSLSSLTPYSN